MALILLYIVIFFKLQKIKLALAIEWPLINRLLSDSFQDVVAGYLE